MSDSKIFVSLRSPRAKAAATPRTSGPQCQWDGCDRVGEHRAPVGQGADGLFFLFCTEHISAYNRGYNYSSALSSPLVARYQTEALKGRRRTFGSMPDSATEAPLPSLKRSGTAKAINARTNASQQHAKRVGAQVRRLKVLEAKAFEALGLPPDATAADIRKRYKERLKMHHPDANQGSRTSEAELSASIEAHRILKLNGFC